jgi:hypothetical protein
MSSAVATPYSNAACQTFAAAPISAAVSAAAIHPHHIEVIGRRGCPRRARIATAVSPPAPPAASVSPSATAPRSSTWRTSSGISTPRGEKIARLARPAPAIVAQSHG